MLSENVMTKNSSQLPPFVFFGDKYGSSSFAFINELYHVQDSGTVQSQSPTRRAISLSSTFAIELRKYKVPHVSAFVLGLGERSRSALMYISYPQRWLSIDQPQFPPHWLP